MPKFSLFIICISHFAIYCSLPAETISTSTSYFLNETLEGSSSQAVITTDIDNFITDNTTTTTTTTATLLNNSDDPMFLERRRLLEEEETTRTDDKDKTKPLRILYTVTTLSEYDKGTRATTRGFDRLMKTLVPVVKEGVISMIDSGYLVDVYIVSHYTMTRQDMVRKEFPSNVHIRFWDNAAPTSYDPEKRDQADAKLWHNTLGLARQHRFVVKDNLFDYDLFLNFEDDMIINSGIVDNYLSMTRTLYKLRETAPDEVSNEQLKNFHGPLTKEQLKRCYPGLMRVEVLLDEQMFGTQQELDPVPVADHPDIDSTPCCHLSDFATSDNRPKAPGSDKVFLWETNIIALGVRHLKELGWVTLLRGPRGRDNEKGLTLADHWSGTQKYFGKDRRPSPGSFNHINNEGG